MPGLTGAQGWPPVTPRVLGDGALAAWQKERRLWFTVRGTRNLNTQVSLIHGRHEDGEGRGPCSQAAVPLSLQAPGVLAPPAWRPRARCSWRSVRGTKSSTSRTEARGWRGTAPGSVSRSAPGTCYIDQRVSAALWAGTQDEEGESRPCPARASACTAQSCNRGGSGHHGGC